MVRFRTARAADVPVILSLVRELADYEKEPSAVVATEADFLRDGFGSVPRFFVVLASEGDAVAGFALYTFLYSTWRGRPSLFLEDLFVRPAFRQRGLGTALMRAVARIAQEERCERYQWQVLDWNEPARRFYASLGALTLTEWLNVRVEGAEKIARLAQGAPDRTLVSRPPRQGFFEYAPARALGQREFECAPRTGHKPGRIRLSSGGARWCKCTSCLCRSPSR